jgi:hypothetical protein
VPVEYEEFVGWPHFFWINPSFKRTEDFQRIWCEKLDKYIAEAKAGLGS